VGEELENGAIVFFDLHRGIRFALYPRKSLAVDATIAPSAPSPTEFSIGHNVNSKKEVDRVIAQAKKAGAKIIKSAQNTLWGGYSDIFRTLMGISWKSPGILNGK
jgi:hypothetical protein